MNEIQLHGIYAVSFVLTVSEQYFHSCTAATSVSCQIQPSTHSNPARFRNVRKRN